MAYSFRLKMTNPSWREVLGQIQQALPQDVRIGVEKAHPRSGARAQRRLVIYRERISTRGAELLEEEGTLTLNIPRFAAPEDVLFALELLSHAADALDSTISTAVGELKREELFSPKVQSLLAKGEAEEVSELSAAVRAGQIVEVAGAVRPFFIGPRLFKALRESDEQLPMRDLLVDGIRKVQFAHLRGYHAATVIGLRKRGQDFTASAWAPEQGYLFAPVDELLMKAPGHPLRLPWAQLPAVARERYRPLDERQVLVDAFSEDEWPELLSRARALVGAGN